MATKLTTKLTTPPMTKSAAAISMNPVFKLDLLNALTEGIN